MLELKHISKVYRTADFEQRALDDVSLSFREQEFVSVLGVSGSGKTTLLNIVGGLDRADSGEIFLNGHSTKNLKSRDWDAYRNNSVGFVFQNYQLISHLSVLDNVAMGMTLSGVRRKERQARAEKALEAVGLKDHLKKRPNQLSGGQAQRVAIARALVNDPEILLADEPTGALDTTTSTAIMDLLKEISHERLVVMVTHDRELAERYSDRIVELRDGKILVDSNPAQASEGDTGGFSLKRTAMNFVTALGLSGRNIMTKKGRTFLTAFASSIGIIGIGLILALSNGFNLQIKSFEEDTMANFPIRVQQIGMDMKQMMQMQNPTENYESYPDKATVEVMEPVMRNLMHRNTIDKAYLDYVDAMDPAWINGMTYTREVQMNLVRVEGDEVHAVDREALNLQAIPEHVHGDNAYFEESLELLAGRVPEAPQEVVLYVSEYQTMHQSLAEALGLASEGGTELPFEDLVGVELAVIPNDHYYAKLEDPRSGMSVFRMPSDAEALKAAYDAAKSASALDVLTIVGVMRPDEEAGLSALMPGILYRDALMTDWLENNEASEVVGAQKEAAYNVLTGQPFLEEDEGPSGGMMMPGLALPTKEDVMRSLGGDRMPTGVDVYPKDFASKGKVTAYLDAWNDGKDEADQVKYLDQADIITSLSQGIMDGITIVLIAFAAISLVVSLIMIGIITYISVLERTREIGILRALGARKKDVSRVFNAETFIIGTLSGSLGLAIVYLLHLPVNAILYEMTELKHVAQLNPLHALALLVISVTLTMLGGLIPARMAANRDAVASLRAD